MSKIHTLLSSVSAPKQNDRVMMVATKNSFLTAAECASIIAQGDTQTSVAGSLGGDDTIKESTRRSKVTYLMHDDENAWLYDRLGLEIQQVNAEAYGYELSGIEAIQLATYDEGDHYDWHTDLGEGDNSTRKLSLSIQLTPADEYDGGELEFMKMTDLGTKNQGAIIFFPSFLHHQVKPVTRGRRYSLVAWVHGDAFK
jgi:PKHD-type hydroxylase